jgi:hypothetical protein
MGLSWVRIAEPERRDRLLLLGALMSGKFLMLPT